MEGRESTAGVQSIERAVAVLRAVAGGRPAGARLGDVAAATRLSKSTTHRILGALIREGLIDQDAGSGLFHLGLEFLALSGMATNRFNLVELAHLSMLRLVERTGDTIYLSIRVAAEAVCLDRLEGSFPIKTLTLNVGDRRPLGVGAGSLAMLAGLPDQEVWPIVDAGAAAMKRFGDLDAATVLELVAATRRQGYAFNDARIIPGMSAVGVSILGRDRLPVAALSVAAISSRMQPDRRETIAEWLRAEAGVLEERLRSLMGEITEAGVWRLSRRRTV